MSEAPPAAREPNPFLEVGWKMAAGAALLLVLLLLGGFLLPGTWSAEASRAVAAPPPEVFRRLEDPGAWRDWTFWPESVAFTREGPARGVGARVSWDDPSIGQGTLSITRSEPPRLLGYRVEVEGGSLVTEGTFRLDPAPGGTRVTWSERGDLGWNPLLSWAALRMGRIQSGELERGLGRLEEALAR